jgi:hypothetical protein
MKTDKKNPEVVFAPGCFDSFDGTQEELDALILEIQTMAESGELFEKSTPVDVDELDDEDLELLAESLGINLDDLDESDLIDDMQPSKKYLQ